MKTVLFLCTGNSCRSIMAEALLNHYGAGKFKAISAGSAPTGTVHKTSLWALKERGIPAKHARSKSVEEFKDEHIDFVITLCDDNCPAFMGSAMKAHWPVRDPAKFEGKKKEIREEFSAICDTLERRVMMFINLPIERMSEATLKEKLAIIGTI